MGAMSRYPITWLRRMRRLEENGYLKPPPLYEFVKSLPKLTAVRKSPRKSRSFPEDACIQAIYDKYPEIKSEAVDLNSFTPPLIRRFAWRQMEFIEKGQSTEEAFALAERHFHKEIEQTQQKVNAVKSSLRIVQEEEERVLNRALRQHRERKERQLQSSVHA